MEHHSSAQYVAGGRFVDARNSLSAFLDQAVLCVFKERIIVNRASCGAAVLRPYRTEGRGGQRLHGDGVVGVASYVPAGVLIGVGEQRAGAGDVLFRFVGVHFVVDFAVLLRDGEHTRAVNGSSSVTGLGVKEADVEPEKVRGIDQKKKRD